MIIFFFNAHVCVPIWLPHMTEVTLGRGCTDFSFFLNLIYFFIQQVLISHPFYTQQCIHVNPNLPIHPTTHPGHFPPFVSIGFFLYFCVSISALQTGSSVPFSRFHIYVLIYNICFSLSDLLHSV